MSNAQLPVSLLFDSGGIRISREIASINGTSYPINGIGSVRVAAPNRGKNVIAGIVLFAIGFATAANAATAAWLWFAVGAACWIFAYLKPYILIIHTASSDRPALTGDKDYLLKVKAAIESAVTMRG